MKIAKILLTVFILFGGINAAFANTPSSKTPVSIDFKDLEIKDFIKLVSRILNKNVLLSHDIPGKVEFISNAPIYKENILEILLSTLDSKGYTLVDSGSYFEVVKSAEVTNYSLPIVRGGEHEYKQMISETITIKNDTADSVAAKIKHLNSKYGKMIAVKESNKILVTDFPKNIDSIKETINIIESKSAKSLKVIELFNTDTEKALEGITKLAKGLLDNRIETEMYEIIANKDNNTLMVVGTPKSISVIEEIVAQIDTKKEAQEVVKNEAIKIVHLSNADAEEVAKVIQSIQSGRQYKDVSEKPTISADKELNAIVIVGNKNSVYELENLVRQLDIEKQQVYVKAQIIEISQSKSSQIGVKYGLQGGTSDSNGLYTFSTNLGGAAIPSSLAGFISSGTFKSALALGASIDFLKNHNAADIVSEPSILCIDNKESSIFVGEVSSILTSAASGDSTTALTRNNYARESIGLTLKVKPRISIDGKVMIEAYTKLEDAVGISNGNPITTNREVKTVAIVNNGESVIIGGLIKNKETDTEQKIPVLGDVPVLGHLFKTDGGGNDKINLVIVLTPYVVDRSSDLSSLQEKLTELNKLQKQYNERVFSEITEKKN